MFSITITIVVLTCLISFYAFSNEKVKNDLLFWPAEIDSRKQYYRFLSYGFVHGDFPHLLFNMFALYSFGGYLESYSFSRFEVFGSQAKFFFILLYVSALVVSTLPDYFKYRNSFGYRALGASGAVSAILFAGIILDPALGVQIYFIPINIPGYIFGPAFLAISAYLAKKGNTSIGHGAHFTGAIYGLVFMIIGCKLHSNFNVVTAFVEQISNRYH